MVESNKIKSDLSIVTPDFTRSFHGIPEVVSYLKMEMDYWSSIENFGSSSDYAEYITGIINGLGRSAIRGALDAIANTSSVVQASDVLAHLGEQLLHFRESEDARIMEELLITGRATAFGLLVALASEHRELSEVVRSLPTGSMLQLSQVIGASSALATERRLASAKYRNLTVVLQEAEKQLNDIRQLHTDTIANRHATLEAIDTLIIDASKEVQIQSAKLEASIQSRTDELSRETKTAFEKLRQNIHNEIVVSSKAMETAVANCEAELTRIANIYTDKKTLDGPAELWDSVRDREDRTIKWSIGIFVMLITLPAVAAFFKWEELQAFIQLIVSEGAGGFSLSGMAVLTIPAFAYGWLLRHVSRVFIQSLTLMADADYRKVLAKTYLGLAENKSAGITSAERALIVNALFRPMPNQGADEGPPSGLMDLFKGIPK